VTDRAIGYVRVSLEREEMISPDIQRAAIEAHCARQGYLLGEVIEDLDRTGRNFARAGVQDAISRVERGEADVVVVWKVSRFGRTRKDWYVYSDKIDLAGGRLESATEGYDATTSTGRFTRGMLVELAAFESDRIGDVWREVHANRRSRGLTHNGRPRYGYRLVDGLYLPDPDTAPIVAGMYADFIAGRGATLIARRLNEAGVPGPGGGPWYADRVNGILLSGFAAGLVSAGKRSATTWSPGAQDAIIDQETWLAYLDVRDQRSTGRGYDTRGKYVLSGLLRCGACGASMSSTKVRGIAGYAFLCSAYKNGRSSTYVSVTRHRAEAVVLDWLAERAAAVEEAAETAKVPVAPDRSAQRADEARRALARLAAGWAAGMMSDESYVAARDMWGARLEAAQAAARPAPAVVLPVGLVEEWETLAVADRRGILTALIEAVEVTPVPGGRPHVEVIPRASH
jgi:DNA invertase Pin-like site-specific DNA recombinase